MGPGFRRGDSAMPIRHPLFTIRYPLRRSHSHRSVHIFSCAVADLSERVISPAIQNLLRGESACVHRIRDYAIESETTRDADHVRSIDECAIPCRTIMIVSPAIRTAG